MRDSRRLKCGMTCNMLALASVTVMLGAVLMLVMVVKSDTLEA